MHTLKINTHILKTLNMELNTKLWLFENLKKKITRKCNTMLSWDKCAVNLTINKEFLKQIKWQQFKS